MEIKSDAMAEGVSEEKTELYRYLINVIRMLNISILVINETF